MLVKYLKKKSIEHRRRSVHSKIEYAMSQVDQPTFNERLVFVAERLSEGN